MLSSGNRISEEALSELKKYTDLIECECPQHLMDILEKVRDFETYTVSCIDTYPKDAAVHKWLQKSAENIDALLSSTILQLSRMEGFIDENNQFVPREKLG